MLSLYIQAHAKFVKKDAGYISSRVDEGTLRKAMEEWNPELYSPKFLFWGSTTPLHVAAEAGFTALAEDILALGFSKLLIVKDNYTWYPVQGAVEREKYGTATFLLKNMPIERYTILCLHNLAVQYVDSLFHCL